MRRLSEEPNVRLRDVPQLLGLATAMEETAAQHHQRLAARMEKLNEREIAGTFSALVEEQRDHIEEIARHSIELTGAPPLAPADLRGLPSEISRSWDEAEASALLTPYRALGVAVDNEMLAFAFYSYVAAHSEDATVRATAEWLAGKALDHAARLRGERRRAYRREGARHARDGRSMLDASSLPEFARQSRRLESRAAVIHRRIAARLAALGENAASKTIAEVAERERAGEPEVADGTVEAARTDFPQPAKPLPLLRAALAEAERLHQAYLDLADHTRDEQVLAAAQQAADRAMQSLAAIAARLQAFG
ncbi:hypothetical protein RFM41_32015 [Mesorhizobium sp. VK25A]|uniref:Ferritin-like diiron domain-containing protein n=1 Tax=Mesorhizobium vachelliae TaxID=3072309 RepID=A0ABU5AED6_9HYPH|nr:MULTISPECIES: hypothetical protein [unclassified Mesorhizobium]MDX8535637.1 hypothetical protein [Mesorhizobium sp. VK25D]MDX8548389.1 hypothetical protein [Mesorhizobium sp. VK25A]